MELQLVNKEIQDKIIELGFNWFKFKQGWYFQKDGEEYYTNCERGISGEEETYRKFEIPITQSLVVKWLRDTKDLFVQIFAKGMNNEIKWYNNVERMEKVKYYDTYEQAEEAGIIEALKLIKTE